MTVISKITAVGNDKHKTTNVAKTNNTFNT